MSRVAAWLRPRTLLRAGLLLGGVLALSACAFVPPRPETTQAKEIFSLYVIVLIMGGAVFVGVEGFILYSVVRYRRRDDTLPTQVHGNNLVELIWTAIPTVIVMALFVMSTLTLNSIEARSATPGVTIEVDGFQWQWTFHYLDADNDPSNDVSVTGSPATPPVMVVPVGEPIHLILRSNDVIHSFYVPAFLVKRDLIPVSEGKAPNELEFTVSDVGTYSGQCAEFCGLSHSRMIFSVQATSRADYETWYAAAQAGEPPAPSVSPGGPVVKLSAQDLAFDLKTLSAPAQQGFTIEFTNKDSLPHNVAIFLGDALIFRGDPMTGAGTISYAIPPLAAGDYRYVCEYHPGAAMTGTLTIH